MIASRNMELAQLYGTLNQQMESQEHTKEYGHNRFDLKKQI